MGPTPRETPGVSSFSDLFNDRCAELGLLSAPEVAKRISEVQPSTSNVDLARSVRNWQAGRNVPRPDFYRIILRALDVDADPQVRAQWHLAYDRARSNRTDKSTATETSAAEVPVKAGSVPPLETRRSEPKPGWWQRFQALATNRRPQLGGGAIIVLMMVASTALIGSFVRDGNVGRPCDAAAGAHWDPGRNPAVEPRAFLDIRASAIEACEEAVRDDPRNARYWFQLGRAFDRDAKWHGRHDNALDAFRRAHELTYPAAALSLGMLYEDGLVGFGTVRDRQPDLVKAAALYAEAAKARLPLGMYCHSIATLFGWSDERPDPVQAVVVAEAAVAAGSRRARSLLADLTARKPSTRHVECSPEYGKPLATQRIAWTRASNGSRSAELQMPAPASGGMLANGSD